MAAIESSPASDVSLLGDSSVLSLRGIDNFLIVVCNYLDNATQRKLEIGSQPRVVIAPCRVCLPRERERRAANSQLMASRFERGTFHEEGENNAESPRSDLCKPLK